MKRVILAVFAVASLGLIASNAALANPPAKIVICHVAGLASDPANHITLELPAPAVYGHGGHFNENGTTQAGHEQDTFGPCHPPQPPFDQCPLIPGDQPEGTDCTPDEPTPPTPPVRCPPPNADGTYGGKDGNPGNDECVPDKPETPDTPDQGGGTPPTGGGGTTPPTGGTTPTKPKPPIVRVPEKEKPRTTPKPPVTAPKPPAAEPTPPTTAEELPYTGFNAAWMGLVGILSIIGGLALRRV